LALGIDAAAHRAALESGGGTVAVIGTGADLVYPTQHRALADQIAACGAIVSEWPLGTPAKPAHFPQRNRLIAGMVKGVLVVEAAQRSGSLITARLANEIGRDVFAIPGSIHAPLSRGCHHLIKEGAKLTETPCDVLEEFGLAPPLPERARKRARAGKARIPAHIPIAGAPLEALPLFDGLPDPPASAPLSAAAATLLDALGHAPAALEILGARTEMNSAALQAALLELELRGRLTVLPGGRYVRHEQR
jgi:DNA processing protein